MLMHSHIVEAKAKVVWFAKVLRSKSIRHLHRAQRF
jgi:hypothetical protein